MSIYNGDEVISPSTVALFSNNKFDIFPPYYDEEYNNLQNWLADKFKDILKKDNVREEFDETNNPLSYTSDIPEDFTP